MCIFSRTCQSRVRLVGKTVVITGANTGIGKETARDLYRRGARVILACRNIEKANATIEELKAIPPSRSDREQFIGERGELAVCKLDLNSLASVRECAKNLNNTEPNIHILINNAGLICPYDRTEDGYEIQFQTNHLGHFLFTLLLLPKLRESAPSRIINVSSSAHFYGTMNFDDLNMEKSYSSIKAYNQSKLANILFTKELSRRLKDAKIEGITTYSLHPGVVASEFSRDFNKTVCPGFRFVMHNIIRPFMKTSELGAQTTIHCATDEQAGSETGLYYKECAITSSSSKSNNLESARRLWDESVKMINLEPQDDLNELLSLLANDTRVSSEQ